MRAARFLGLTTLAAGGGLGLAAMTLGTHSGVTAAERARALPGDDLVPEAQVVIDRATTLSAPPGRVWPWVVQLGRERAGWYLPAWLERLVPRGRRALRHLDPAFQSLAVGDEVPDWGPGVDPVLRVAEIRPPHALVYVSERARGSGSRCGSAGHTHSPRPGQAPGCTCACGSTGWAAGRRAWWRHWRA